MQTTSRAPWRHFTAGAATAIVLALSACGGGGGSDTAAAASPASLTITGTAADGTAIAAGSVDARCVASGSAASANGSAATAADGSFTLTITGAALPCVLRVSSGTLVLHGLATGSGASARANLTPVSELVVAQLTASTAASYFGSFGSSAAATLTPAAVQTAASAVLDILKAGGVDFSAAGDVMAGTLVAANGSTSGNAYDKALDMLKAQLTASGTTLAVLAQTVAASSPTAPAAALSSTASLPAEMLLRPAAPNCAALRSGRYRLVQNEAGSAPQAQIVTVDAPALKVTNAANETFTFTATGNCSFTNPAGGDVVVTKAGVVVARIGASAGNALVAGVFFPEQAHTVAELAGEWNAMAFDRTTTNGPIHATSYTTSVDSNGKLTTINFCDDLRSCVASTAATLPNVTHTVSAAGGFNEVNATDNYTDRAFLYRAGGGELMAVTLAAAGHISFATRKVVSTLPALGRVTESWNMTLTAQYTAPTAITVSRNTVVSLDSAGGSFVRTAIQNSSTGATRPETLQINSLRDGYLRRLPATGVVHSDGSTSTVSEFIGLTMRGMDLFVLALPASNQMVLAPTISAVNP